MGLEQNNEQHYREVVDKYNEVITTPFVMSPRDYVVRVSTQGIGPTVIQLPPVAEAKGRFYSIVVRAASAVNTVTIQDAADSECWTNIVFNGKCDAVLLYSDGLFWHPMIETRTRATGAPGTATATTVAPTTLATGQATTLAPTTTG